MSLMDDSKIPAVSDGNPEVSTVDTSTTWTAEEEKKLVRKIDLRIFPPIIILFILNFIDRNNFSNARLEGLETDLHLTDIEYQTCISILLVGYVTMQIPSNMFLNTLTRPSLYLCSAVAIWGIVSACTAACQNATGAILCRFILGCVEAAFFPGSLLFLARWYTRREMQLRVTIINAGNIAAQAFGGLIAAGILGEMEGVRGVAAWRWLFIIEGAITITIAALAYPLLPDWPHTTTWLTPHETHIASHRLVLDIGTLDTDPPSSSATSTAFHGLKLALTDPRVYILALLYFLTIMGLSFSFFFPTITAALGYSTTSTLLLTAPPWLFAICVTLPNAWHADRTSERLGHYLFPAISAMVGYAISMGTSSVGPRYFSTFLMTTGYGAGFVVLAWISSTVARPPAKRAVALGLVNACGNIGSIPGTYMWRSMYGPWYRVPFGACLGIMGGGCLVAVGLRWYLVQLNKKLDAEEEREGVVFEGAAAMSAPMAELGDEGLRRRAKGFRYLY